MPKQTHNTDPAARAAFDATMARKRRNIMTEHMSDCALHKGPALQVGQCELCATQEEFVRLSRPLIEFLNREGCHPHMKIIIDGNGAEMVEGVRNFITYDYLRD